MGHDPFQVFASTTHSLADAGAPKRGMGQVPDRYLIIIMPITGSLRHQIPLTANATLQMTQNMYALPLSTDHTARASAAKMYYNQLLYLGSVSHLTALLDACA
jgi:hypothetical protein